MCPSTTSWRRSSRISWDIATARSTRPARSWSSRWSWRARTIATSRSSWPRTRSPPRCARLSPIGTRNSSHGWNSPFGVPMPESYQELLDRLAKELDARAKANEQMHGSTLKAISENLASERKLLDDQAQQADKHGDAETRDRLTARR